MWKRIVALPDSTEKQVTFAYMEQLFNLAVLFSATVLE
jgi:hypothetical protein